MTIQPGKNYVDGQGVEWHIVRAADQDPNQFGAVELRSPFCSPYPRKEQVFNLSGEIYDGAVSDQNLVKEAV